MFVPTQVVRESITGQQPLALSGSVVAPAYVHVSEGFDTLFMYAYGGRNMAEVRVRPVFVLLQPSPHCFVLTVLDTEACSLLCHQGIMTCLAIK